MIQMITDPPILFCDEPTTGLDSYNASSVVTVLRQLTARGKIVVCSIHQPASDVFVMFDQLCLLAPGGRLAYFGDTVNAQPYFARSTFHLFILLIYLSLPTPMRVEKL